jgi:hypothetical protein
MNNLKDPRNIVCKVDSSDKIIYIIYVKYICVYGDIGSIYDVAGMFNDKKDAVHVKDCLNNLFPHLIDEHWTLAEKYKIVEQNYFAGKFYQVMSSYTKKPGAKLGKQVMIEVILNCTDTMGEAESMIKSKDFTKNINDQNFDVFLRERGYTRHPQIFIKKYRVNDVMPTMHLDDYNIVKHQENMKNIVKKLQTYPTTKRLENKDVKVLIKNNLPRVGKHVTKSPKTRLSKYIKKSPTRSPRVTQVVKYKNNLYKAKVTSPKNIDRNKNQIYVGKRNKNQIYMGKRNKKIMIRDMAQPISEALRRKNFGLNSDNYTGMFIEFINFLIKTLQTQARYIKTNKITMDDVHQVSHLINNFIKNRTYYFHMPHHSDEIYPFNYKFTVKDVENYKMHQPVINLNMVKNLVDERLQNYETNQVYVSKDVLIFIWKIFEMFVEQEYGIRKLQKDINNDIKYMPGKGIKYQEMVNEPAFKERWKKYDSKIVN